MSRKQLFSRMGFGRKKDNRTPSLSPRHQNGNAQQFAGSQQKQQKQQKLQKQQQHRAAFQESKQAHDYNGAQNGHANGHPNGHHHNQAKKTHGSSIHNSNGNGHNIASPSNGNATQSPNANPNGNASDNKQHSKSHKSRSKHANGKRKHKAHHTERMTIETSALSTEMSQEDVIALLRLDTKPSYHVDDRGYIDFSRGLFMDQRFILLETLGRGTFSKVFEAIDVVDKTKIAIKVIRNSHRYIEAAKTELRVLQHITNADDGRSCCIHLKDHFHWNKHPVLVFRLYGPSIYTVMAKNHYRPFPDPIVKQLTIQICTAIQFMHHLGIIFTDLKPENMVFVDGRTQMVINAQGKQEFLPVDARIKLVDFGSAVYEPVYNPKNPKTHKFKNGYNYLIQTRHYRAPEVVLEMPWKRQVDVWSIGCVILEFLYGSMVFNTHCAIDHLNQMQKMIGKLPHRLIKDSSDKAYEELFTSDGQLNLEKAKISRAQAKPLRSYFKLDTNIEHQALYDLVQRTLRWEAKDRISADAVLRHAYFQINVQEAQQQQQLNGYANGHASGPATQGYPPQYAQAQANGHSKSKAVAQQPSKNGYPQQAARQAPQQPLPPNPAQGQGKQQQAPAQGQGQGQGQQYMYSNQPPDVQAQIAKAQQRVLMAAQQGKFAVPQQQQYVNNNGYAHGQAQGQAQGQGQQQQPYITR